MMRRFALAAMFFAAAPAAAQDGYVPGIEDLPLMPGLSENADALVVFDKPDGRIVQTVAAGRVGPRAVLEFYAQTAPQLGWADGVAIDDSYLVFQRDRERLTVAAMPDGTGGAVVTFRIDPADR